MKQEILLLTAIVAFCIIASCLVFLGHWITMESSPRNVQCFAPVNFEKGE